MAAEERKEEEEEGDTPIVTVGRVVAKEESSSSFTEEKIIQTTSVLSSSAEEERKPSSIIASSNDSACDDDDGDDGDDGDEEEEQEPSQVSLGLSQTDEQIQKLEEDGQLDQVVGSQSMLSQELIYHSSQLSQQDEGYTGIYHSQPTTETSLSMAKRIGLLAQEEEESSSSTTPIQPKVTFTTTVAATTTTTTTTSSSAGDIPDTPVRESECFGSLLDAVQKITEQEEEEEVNAQLYALQQQQQSPNNNHNKRKSPQTSSSRKNPRKSEATKKKESEAREAQEIAKRAADLAEQTVADPEMAKKLLLSMALVRENPRSCPSRWPPWGAVVPEGFFWAHYPPLEAVLKKHMAEYYELSTTKCQSAQQQNFNNDLVVFVRDVARTQGWKFHSSFCDKSLRDRIRCYYKTHIQNAKKRLRTMVRNPTKRANAKHLCAHLDLIQLQHHHDGGGDDDAMLPNKEQQQELNQEEINQKTIQQEQAPRVKKESPKNNQPTNTKKEPKPSLTKVKKETKSPSKLGTRSSSRRPKPTTTVFIEV